MSEYLPIDLRRRIRGHFGGCCAYCRSAEELTVAIFEIEQLIGLTPSGRATIGALRMNRPQLIRVRRMWVELGEHPPAIQTPQ